MTDKQDTAAQNVGQVATDARAAYAEIHRRAMCFDNMLESLRMVTCLEQGFTEDGRVMPSPETVINAVYAAIAKAEGKA